VAFTHDTIGKETRLTMTTLTTHPFNPLTDPQQLVLFPEMIGLGSLPLDQCAPEEVVPVTDREEVSRSYQQALDAGQLLLFPWASREAGIHDH
jgi:hypothetical protein